MLLSYINTALLVGIFFGVWWGALNSTGSVLTEMIRDFRVAVQTALRVGGDPEKKDE